MREIAKGWHSTIYLTDRGTIIKRFKKGMERNFEKELNVLKKLSSYDFVPKVISYNKDRLEIEMEYIKGKNLREILRYEKNRDRILKILREIFEKCYILDKLGIQKEEMNFPEKHIIISNDKIYFIDFERAIEKKRPSNVTQFVEYLYRRRDLLEKIGIEIKDREHIIGYLKKYKGGYSREIFEKLLEEIFSS